MAVYTRLNSEDLSQLGKQSGIQFESNTLQPIESGSTDTCYSLLDKSGSKYFLKIHENQESSPHALNVDQSYMVEFAQYLSTYNKEFKMLHILQPFQWATGKVYGLLQSKVVSLWPYLTPKHPTPKNSNENFDLLEIRSYGKATAELHNASSMYSPKKVQLFPRDIIDTERMMRKIDCTSSGIENISKYLDSYENPFTGQSIVFLQMMREKIQSYAQIWQENKLDRILDTGYIHGELKPSNTLIGKNREIIFMDICKSGLAPFMLEVGMAAHHFTNSNEIYVKGIETFIESYLSTRNSYTREELKYIPFLIKVSAIRLAVYRTYAVATGYSKQKFINTPLQICLDLEGIEEDFTSSLLS